MNQPEKNTIPFIVQFVILLYSLRLCLPAYAHYMPAVVNVALLAFLYMAVFGGRVRLRANDFFAVIPIFSVYILSLLYEIPSNWATYIYSLAQTFIYPLLGLYLIKSDDKKIVKRLFIILVIAYLVTCVTTYIGCIMYPQASRTLATLSETENVELYSLYTGMNIGSFTFVYALVLILPLLLCLVRNKMINVIIGIVALIMVVMTILVTEYATALIFMIVAFTSFIFPKKFGAKHIFLTIAIVAILFVSVKSYVGQAFQILATNLESEMLAVRFQSLSDMFLEGEKSLEGDIEARADVYTDSIEAFEDSPIWGGSNKTVGGHSYILDNMGKYGIFGLVAMIIMYSTLYRLYIKPYKCQTYFGYILLSFFIAMVLAILNPKEYLTILTYIIPLFTVSYKAEKI